ncbi:MAG: hypothetical protein JOY61_07950 [Chloroflexi bacterium]|nr:hypothetical protein [Chloroflexota bacterium]
MLTRYEGWESSAVNTFFWIIQIALLMPLLVMAFTAGLEGPSRRSRVTAAISGLNQFTAEQQARLVRLRGFVQAARLTGGPLADDLRPALRARASVRRIPVEVHRTRGQRAVVALACLLVVVGAAGVFSTNSAMDGMRSNVPWTEPLTPAQRFLPGVFADPARYISALNGAVSGAASVSWTDPFYAIAVMDQKVAMDRWEALAGLGIALLLFASALRSVDPQGESRALAFDVAPMVMVASVMFAALSLCELP